MDMSLQIVRDVLFAALLIASAITDLRERRILNALTYPALLSGLLLALAAGAGSFLSAAGGAILAAAVLYPFCRAGGMGLGDLKLLAAVGALEGFTMGASALVDSVFVGGIFAAGVAVSRGDLPATLKRSLRVPGALVRSARRRGAATLRPARAGDAIPYGVAIALGSAAAWWWRWPW